MSPRPVQYNDVFELRITLRDTKPPIWRRVRVPATVSLAALHEVIQVAMGWTDSHLHDFVVGNIRFGKVEVEEDALVVDEKCAPLGGIANEGSTFLYRYDFGDDWEHEIRVERVVKGDGKDIVCTGGARACPPEDCGGSSGYAGLLKVLADKEHGEHARMRQWVGGGFNPEMFDMEGVNKGLASLSRRRGRRAKK